MIQFLEFAEKVLENAEKRIEAQQGAECRAADLYDHSLCAGVCRRRADSLIFHGL